MRILFTGMQGRQVTEKEFSRDYTPTERPMIKALRALGHDVTVSPVRIGDRELREQYDLAVVGLSGYHQLTSLGNRYGTLWCLSQLPHVAFIGDWQLAAICSGLKNPEETLWNNVGDLDEQAHAITMPEIHAAAEALKRPPNILLPLHEWGDTGAYKARHHRACGNVWSWDPSPFQLDELAIDGGSGDRREAWFCTSLSDVTRYLRSLGVRWPVEGYWDKRVHTYIKESEILETHLRTYGGVIVPDRSPGNEVSGWWRARNMHYAARKIPVGASKNEMGRISDSFPPAAEIEMMHEDGRKDLAEEQSMRMLSAVKSQEQSSAGLGSLLSKAVTAPLYRGN